MEGARGKNLCYAIHPAKRYTRRQEGGSPGRGDREQPTSSLPNFLSVTMSLSLKEKKEEEEQSFTAGLVAPLSLSQAILEETSSWATTFPPCSFPPHTHALISCQGHTIERFFHAKNRASAQFYARVSFPSPSNHSVLATTHCSTI